MNQAFLEHRAKYRDIVARRYKVTPEMYDEVSRMLAPLAVPVSVRKGEYLQRIGALANTNGRRWREIIYPQVRDFISTHRKRAGARRLNAVS